MTETDVDRLDRLTGRKKRLKREIRTLLGTIDARVRWVELALREPPSHPALDDETIDEIDVDLGRESDVLAVKLYEFAAVRDELAAMQKKGEQRHDGDHPRLPVLRRSP